MRQHRIEMLAGANGLIVNHLSGTVTTQVFQKLLNRQLVSITQGTWVAGQVTRLLHALKLRCTGIVKVQFLIIHHMKDHHIVAARSQEFQALQQPRSIGKKV